MKNLLFIFLLFASLLQGQTKILTWADSLKAGSPSGGDTTFVLNLQGNYRWVYITYTDTGSSVTDTVTGYYSAGTDTTVWVQSAMYSPTDDEVKPVITNAGTSKMYLFYVPRPNWIKLVLSNSGGGIIAGRKGTFIIRALNENY